MVHDSGQPSPYQRSLSGGEWSRRSQWSCCSRVEWLPSGLKIASWQGDEWSPFQGSECSQRSRIYLRLLSMYAQSARARTHMRSLSAPRCMRSLRVPEHRCAV
eukprot:1161760-Pelagomonas_calceolata.AAC.10